MYVGASAASWRTLRDNQQPRHNSALRPDLVISALGFLGLMNWYLGSGPWLGTPFPGNPHLPGRGSVSKLYRKQEHLF